MRRRKSNQLPFNSTINTPKTFSNQWWNKRLPGRELLTSSHWDSEADCSVWGSRSSVWGDPELGCYLRQWRESLWGQLPLAAARGCCLSRPGDRGEDVALSLSSGAWHTHTEDMCLLSFAQLKRLESTIWKSRKRLACTWRSRNDLMSCSEKSFR